MGRFIANPLRKPEIIARIRKFVVEEGGSPGKPGNKAIAEMVLREFQIVVTTNQVAGGLTREGIDRGGYGKGSAANRPPPIIRPTPPPLPPLASLAAQVVAPPKRFPTIQRQRFSSTIPATRARASGGLSPFDGLTYRAPQPYTPPAPRTGRVIECMWIEGDGKPWIMCPDMSLPGSSWCAAHGKRAVVRIRKNSETQVPVPV